MPDLLFIVADEKDYPVYHCHNLLELFRLRGKYQHTDRLYRYIKGQKVDGGVYFQWNKIVMCWIPCTIKKDGYCFQRITFEELEKNYQFILKLKKGLANA